MKQYREIICSLLQADACVLCIVYLHATHYAYYTLRIHTAQYTLNFKTTSIDIMLFAPPLIKFPLF